MWRRLGNFETRVLGDEIRDTSIKQPVYVTSLPRSGTTIVTEMLENHPGLTSHHYSDFPNVWTPYWRNHLLQKSRREAPRVEERAHRDRIQISNDSPEAVEEVLWMHYFPGWIHEDRSHVLDSSHRNHAFDDYYQAHIQKLLTVRGSERYLAKGNYNIARLKYLLDLFPDARFLVLLRDPVSHIASLAKQHDLFLAADREDPRVSRQLAMSGHHEFGPGRRLVHFGDDKAVAAIRDCWARGLETEGWARYWAQTYDHLEKQLRDNEDLRKAVLLFRYEDLCEHSLEVIDSILSHCALEAGSFTAQRKEYEERLSEPDYYQPAFSEKELETIQAHCGPVLAALQKHCLNPV